MDINEVFLQGRIGDDFKYAKDREGKEFATFSLCLNGKFRGSDAVTYIRINVFHPIQIKYLHDVHAHIGNRVTISGFLQSYKKEIKGENIIQNTVIVRDISIRKTQNSETQNSETKD